MNTMNLSLNRPSNHKIKAERLLHKKEQIRLNCDIETTQYIEFSKKCIDISKSKADVIREMIAKFVK